MDDRQDYFDEQDSAGRDAPDEKKQLSRKTRLIIGMVASVIILALGLTIPLMMTPGEPETLTVTVFSNDWAKTLLEPGVETPLNEYLASDSKVPGFPLLVSYGSADDIQLKVDGGTLFTWGEPDYTADNKGSEYATESGGTVYWSPFDADCAFIPQCTLTVTARKSGADVSQLRLILRQTGETGYSITLLAAK